MGSHFTSAFCREIRSRRSHHYFSATFFMADLQEHRTKGGQWFGPQNPTTHLIKRAVKAQQKFEDSLLFHNCLIAFCIIGPFPLEDLKEINLLPVSSEGDEISSDCGIPLSKGHAGCFQYQITPMYCLWKNKYREPHPISPLLMKQDEVFTNFC